MNGAVITPAMSGVLLDGATGGACARASDCGRSSGRTGSLVLESRSIFLGRRRHVRQTRSPTPWKKLKRSCARSWRSGTISGSARSRPRPKTPTPDAKSHAEAARLKAIIARRRRRQYGPRSERLDPDQYRLKLDALHEQSVRRQPMSRRPRMRTATRTKTRARDGPARARPARRSPERDPAAPPSTSARRGSASALDDTAPCTPGSLLDDAILVPLEPRTARQVRRLKVSVLVNAQPATLAAPPGLLGLGLRFRRTTALRLLRHAARLHVGPRLTLEPGVLVPQRGVLAL